MKKASLLIIIAFIFSIFLRFNYVDTIQSKSEFKYNGEYIINTNDGYTFAKGAKEIASGEYKDREERAKFDNIALDEGISKVTALIVKITNIKAESVIFYLSAIFSSLVVIPVILIGWSIGSLEVGFIAALLSSIAWSYYNRTMLGYYDTDMLNIVFPSLLLWSLIGAIKSKKSIYLIITSIEIIAYRWWYPASYSIDFSLIAMVGIYLATVQYFKKDYLVDLKNSLSSSSLNRVTSFYLALVAFMLIGINNLPDIVRVSIAVVLYAIYLKNKDIFKKYIWYILGIAVVIFLATGGLDPIISKLNYYVFKSDVTKVGDSLNLHFFNVAKTISEAGAIPFNTVANRISGNMVIFILSIVGFIALLVKHRYLILSLPLIILGVISYSSGLRFTIYAVVPLALGVAYLIVYVSKYISNNYIKGREIYFISLSLLTMAILYPNIKHIIQYDKRIRPVFIKSEIDALDKIKNKMDKKDYIVAWWDYGYPLKFYSRLNTLTDGAIHNGAVNFPVSYSLIEPQNRSAKMARLSVEYHEKRFLLPNSDKDKNRTDIEYMILDNGYKSANKFLNDIDTIKLPKKTRDVYLYLPERMLRIFPVVNKFSDLNIENGENYNSGFFLSYSNYKIANNNIYLPYNNRIDVKKGILIYNNKSIKINKLIVTNYKNGKFAKRANIFDITSKINVIYVKSSRRVIILDDKMLNSTYIQLFLLENYEKDLYEPVILTPLIKIFKLKI